jgi:hypothetical protein
MSGAELRSTLAAQLLSGMLRDIPPNTPESSIKTLAEHAVNIAKAIEEAAARSLRP